jgi:DNA-binding MarR family transcriptional regulator
MDDKPELQDGAKATLQSLAAFRFELRRFLSFSEMASERCGIGVQQYQLMQVIGALPEGQEASIMYLAERMVLRHNSTVELVDRGERAGLVKRMADPRDLRRALVKLTPEGETMLQRLVAEHLGELAPRSNALIEALSALQRVMDASPEPAQADLSSPADDAVTP